ncbi:MAG TPA: glycerate dehydrogenase, partial [Clostridiaceae bacterium]|nr:glycerate dehydrogenase [Clostridiaceae bacterium]
VLATGYNIVDVEAAKELGIVVTNIPTYGTTAVAQMTFALLLEMCHHVWMHSEAVKNGDWTNSEDFCFWNYPLIELAGKTMGIIGFGRIGQAVGRIAQAFGMKVIANDMHIRKELESDTLKYANLDELFTNSDVISLHAPLFESTKGIINKNTISKMKDGVMIINTSRGPLIVDEDLAEALK